MSIADKLVTIAENMQRVYEAGKSQGGGGDDKAFWDIITNNNTRADWSYAFQYWNCEHIRPPYVIKPTKNLISTMFGFNTALKSVEKARFDFSGYTPTQTNGTSSWYKFFDGCENLETVEDIGMKAGACYRTFAGCKKLETIEKLRVQAETVFNTTFAQCDNLQNITIEGTIGQNGFSVYASNKISKASILSILNACNKGNAGITVTLPSKCVDGATDTLATITEDTELNTAYITATQINNYTISFV